MDCNDSISNYFFFKTVFLYLTISILLVNNYSQDNYLWERVTPYLHSNASRFNLHNIYIYSSFIPPSPTNISPVHIQKKINKWKNTYTPPKKQHFFCQWDADFLFCISSCTSPRSLSLQLNFTIAVEKHPCIQYSVYSVQMRINYLHPIPRSRCNRWI